MIEQAIGKAYAALMGSGAKTATVYLSPSLVVRVTRQGKIYSRPSRETVLVTIGRPNYLAVRVIRDLKKAGEPFPVKKAILSGTAKRYSRVRAK